MQVWYINLDRRTDRREAMRAYLANMSVPTDKIVRIQAVDRDIFDTPNALIDYAIGLGYTDFQKYLIFGNHLQYLGYMVSYISALDAIAEQNETVLLMEDDYRLRESYPDICASFADLPEPVKFAMLGYWEDDPKMRTCESVSEDSVWQFGTPALGNAANIYTPDGAKFIRDACLEGIPKTCEVTIQRLPIETLGVYSRKFDKICISRFSPQGDTDVRNEKGKDFASKLL